MSTFQLLCFTLFCLLPVYAHAQSQPNILLIIADDMGIDASNCYDLGDQQAPMPNLKSLCERGLVFENGYTAPVCSPTRATIMTGKYGFRTGVGSAIPPNGTNGLSADEITLFDVLAETNYRSNLIGKWHLADKNADLHHPAQLGVPDYFGLIRGATRDYYNWTAVTDGEEQQINGYTTTVFTDHAIEWIDQQDGPWFLWLAHNAPHAPFHLPPSHLHSFGDLEDDMDAAAKDPLPYYQAMLEALDSEIGRLLKSIPDNTIVMFIGDNGSPNQVTRNMFGNHAAKGTIYESGTNVPFVVAGPGVTAGRSKSFVQSVDLFATIASLAGAKSTATDSIDFSSVLDGNAGIRDSVYLEHFADVDARRSEVFGWALRIDDMKLLWLEKNNTYALYNVEQDPKESTNLLADGVSENEQIVVDKIKSRYNRLIANQAASVL